MRRVCLLVAIFMVCAWVRPDDEKTILSVKQMEEDLQQLTKTVKSAWSYAEDKKKNFQVDPDKIQKELIARLKAPMDLKAFLQILKEYIAEMKEGHASARIPNMEGRWRKNRILPFGVIDAKEGVIISKVHPSAAGISIGDKLLKIDGTPIENRIQESYRITSASTEGSRRHYAIKKALTTRSESITIETEGPNNKVASLSVDTLKPGADWSVDLLDKKQLDWRFITPQIGYLRIATFQPDPSGWRKLESHDKRKDFLKPYLEKVDQAFNELKDTKALILDLRDNTGGTDSMGQHVAKHFLSGEFVYFHLQTQMSPELLALPGFEFYRNMTPEQREALKDSKASSKVTPSPNIKPYKGKTYVLINEGCFSTTDNFCACLDDLHPNVQFIGRPTNGGTGAPRKITTLKHSKAEIRFCVMRVWSPKGRMTEGRGVKPDIPVKWSRQDLCEGRDADLMTAVKIAGEELE